MGNPVTKANFEPCLGPWDIERELRETLLPRRVCEASFESIGRRDGREPWGTLGALGNPDTIASEMRGEMGGSLWECPREVLGFLVP